MYTVYSIQCIYLYKSWSQNLDISPRGHSNRYISTLRSHPRHETSAEFYLRSLYKYASLVPTVHLIIVFGFFSVLNTISSSHRVNYIIHLYVKIVRERQEAGTQPAFTNHPPSRQPTKQGSGVLIISYYTRKKNAPGRRINMYTVPNCIHYTSIHIRSLYQTSKRNPLVSTWAPTTKYKMTKWIIILKK